MEVASLIASLAAILIGSFIAYHVYFLQKRLTFNDKMRHASAIRKKATEQLHKIKHEGINSEVMLVNVRRYEIDYEGENTKSRYGYIELKAELKEVRYNGIEFFADMPKQAFFDENDRPTLNDTGNKAFTVFPVGLIPYEWIEYVDLEGDEYRYVPIFYTQYKGSDKYPWKQVRYYKKTKSSYFELVSIRN